ncbi:hypothetical protein A9404_00345 [Halothiobacillus diazotrophicus]|uniref:Uncharacterized protein n=1 Tax=Halothiobacillus diazotrophicus TaxID=1860122 RepID=A0A191ZDT6_9GAMM|nr:hypothetical protein [Halothiobacillus diazotrophicus]ANJ66033.1 hypothetical protein A9404_00345 [Halothiobacillus diazotrophicus]
MTNQEFDFEVWFDTLTLHLMDRGVRFHDEDAVREDYESGRDVYDLIDEIAAEYDVEGGNDATP